MSDLAKAFMARFAGHPDAHGVYELTVVDAPEGQKLSGRAFTKRKPVTLELWVQHLKGKNTLGVIPIDDKNLCVFGAIDIDQYDLDLLKLVKKVSEKGFPLIVCRSKSGGAHLYLFTSEPVSAKAMRDKLASFATALNYKNSEIFPKQEKLDHERGDLGNWINMPYFDAFKTKRFAFDDNSKPLPPEDFLALAAKKAVGLATFTAMGAAPRKRGRVNVDQNDENTDLPGGPPCLQSLWSVPEDTTHRNNLMYNTGVYLKKAFPATEDNPEGWKKRLRNFNDKFKTPLGGQELDQVIRSVEKKEYFYKCHDLPISACCDQPTCRLREYGIGRGGKTACIVGLQKYETDPPVWFATLDTGQTLKVDTEDLQDPRRFQKRCMAVLDFMPPVPKNQEWLENIQRAMQNIQHITVPEEAGSVGQAVGHIEKFCTNAPADSPDGLLLGRAYFDRETDYYHFRVGDLYRYLDQKKFWDLAKNELVGIMRYKMNAEPHDLKVKGKIVITWRVRIHNKQTEAFDTPEQVKESY